MPHLDARAVFGAATLRRAGRYDAFLRVDWLVEQACEIALLAVLVVAAPRLVPRLRGGPLFRGAQLAALAWALVWIVRFPFGLTAHWWSKRYGVSRQGYGAWLVQRLPSPVELAVLLAVVAGGMLLARSVGPRWWIAAAPALAVGGLVLALVQPLFGPALHPLRYPALRAEVRAAGVEAGVAEVAKRTRAANAEAIGLGPTARIVFDDTLLRSFGPRALRFVGAHEVAHHTRRHLWKGVAWFALFSLPCAFAIAWATERRGGLARPEAVPVALLVAFCLQLLAVPIGGAIARRYEAEADWTALRATHDPVGARRLFTGFARVNLEDPTPPWWSRVLLDDHPSLLERVALATAEAGSRGGS